jgi:hypothetical protein
LDAPSSLVEFLNYTLLHGLVEIDPRFGAVADSA